MKKLILISLVVAVLAGGTAWADEVDDILKMVPDRNGGADSTPSNIKSLTDSVNEGLNNFDLDRGKAASEVEKSAKGYVPSDFDSVQPDLGDDANDSNYIDAAKNFSQAATSSAEAAEIYAGLMDDKAAEAASKGDNATADLYRKAADNYRDNAVRYRGDAAQWQQKSQTEESKVSILPATNLSVDKCLAEVMREVNVNPAAAKAKFEARDDREIRIILGCAVKTGDIKLWMVPYFVRYVLEFIVQLGALAAVGGIVYGGYLYMFAGVSDDKDRGKTAIMYSVGGIVVMAVAWAVVNVFISFFI